ncbi:hypothetical protein HMSSN036_91310 [Paenibacillus macerans]|nr:hypothetical protein HMSSN036_91310 [Paenibacillus macerans]
MGMRESKQYLMLEDKPIFIHTLEAFDRHPEIAEMVLVTGGQDVDRCRSWIAEFGMTKQVQVIPGGAERQQSVYQGCCISARHGCWCMTASALLLRGNKSAPAARRPSSMERPYWPFR